MSRFIKYIPDSEISQFLESKPIANHLALIIAKRARRTKCLINNLEIGEAFIGDCSKIGITEQQYRTAKKQLAKINFATFRTTNKGTIAKLANTEVWDINTESCNGQSNEQTTDKHTPKQRVTKNVKNKRMKESSLIEENDFDLRLDKNVPFDVVSSSKTLTAAFQKPYTELKEDLKNIFAIDATDSDIERAIFTFSTVGVASYDKYKSIRDFPKLCDMLKEWIPKSIRFEGSKPKEQPQDLEAYLLANFPEKDVRYFKSDGKLETWNKLLSENLFKVTNLAKAYKNENLSPLFFFEILFMPLSGQLNGSSQDRKLESFKKIFDAQSDYNKEKSDFRKIIKAAYEKQKA